MADIGGDYRDPTSSTVQKLGRGGTFFVLGSTIGDITPPVITNFVPTVGNAIEADTVLQFDVLDSGGLRRIMVMARFGSDTYKELVHDGDAFNGPYTGGGSNTRTAIEGGYRYTLLRSGGWPSSSVNLIAVAIDEEGNESTP